MNRNEFWSIIETARNSNVKGGDLRNEIENLLYELSDKDLVDYATIYHQLIDNAGQWRLWDAIYLINDGCGDDGFFDFRDFLISKGQNHFKRVLDDPESLLDDVLDSSGEWQYHEVHFRYAANNVYRKRNNKLDDDDFELDFPLEWSGTQGKSIDVDDDEQIQSAFPRIWQHVLERRTKK